MCIVSKEFCLEGVGNSRHHFLSHFFNFENLKKSWIFQITPNLCILDEFEGSYGRFSTKQHFFGTPCRYLHGYILCLQSATDVECWSGSEMYKVVTNWLSLYHSWVRVVLYTVYIVISHFKIIFVPGVLTARPWAGRCKHFYVVRWHGSQHNTATQLLHCTVTLGDMALLYW